MDRASSRPRAHGLQVGEASYLVSLLQGENTDVIAELLEVTGFWVTITADPFSLSEWQAALQLAPTPKDDFYTILSVPERLSEADRLLTDNVRLASCFGEEE